MTTQYTTILKLALPVQGELSGTWGDVVNDNITQMVEQAVAGKAVINTWTANSHTLTTADGTTSESRCAILELTDSGTALTGAGTVVCPTNTKLYIVDNNTAEIITVQTAAGTGVAVPVGKTMLVYCDGTNVVEGVTHANSLSLGTSTVTADKILDEDNMASDSATAIATQQSIKAYVDSQVGTVDTLSEILANGNTTGANDIDVDSAQKVQFRDADIYLNSSVDGQLDIVADTEIQIAATTVDLNGNLDVSGTALVTGVLTTTAATVFNGGFASNADSTLGTDKKVQFRDAAIYLNSSVDGQLDIVADGEVQIDTALVDINGNLDVSGTTNISGSVSFTKNAIAGVAISTTSRASNTVTVTTSAVHGLTSGDLVNVNGVADTSFNGYFTVSVSSTTVFTYSQTGADGSSTGGTSTEVVYNLNASGTALNWMNGPLNIAANSGIDGLEITQSGSGEALSITGGNAIFGDNDKAVFGAGSDLQIYHDGSNSYVKDDGAGDLIIQAYDDIKFQQSTDNADLVTINTGGNVTIHGGNLDVTGSVTADGLTVDASSAVIQSATGTSSPTPTTFNISTTSNGSDWTTTSPWGRLAFYSGDGSGGGGKPHVVLDATASNAIGASSSFSVSTTSESANTLTKRLNLANNGDLSLYEDTGTTPKFFWDASAESLGIGTSSPATGLHLNYSNDAASIRFQNTANAKVWDLVPAIPGVANSGFSLHNVTDNTIALHVDNSNNVGIGQSVPKTILNASTSTGAILTLESSDTTLTTNDVIGGINFYANDGSTNGTGAKVNIKAIATSTAGTVTALTFGTSDSASATAVEAMRIDGSGNVGIGNSGVASTRFAVTGAVVGANIETTSSTAAHEALIVNRQNSDGVAIAINKAGATVGSIGANGGRPYLVNNVDGGIHLSTDGYGRALLLPADQNGAPEDNLHYLGSSSYRWRDLYLSGGVVFGTTGGAVASKTLDDYEEGAWTPVTNNGSWTVNAASYTKVGNMVTCRFKVTATATIASNDFTGLPFVPAAESGGVCGYQNSEAGEVFSIAVQSSNVWNFRVGSDQKGLASGALVYGAFTYQTTA
jgi:hypothetical protein